MPGGKLTILYSPSSPVTVSRACSISAGLVTWTFAPATLPPEESSTAPAMTPEFLPACPHADVVANRNTARKCPTRFFLIVTSDLGVPFCGRLLPHDCQGKKKLIVNRPSGWLLSGASYGTLLETKLGTIGDREIKMRMSEKGRQADRAEL